eukprot:symbB.v1.2.014447.t1/scaffold1039.1/size142581/3
MDNMMAQTTGSEFVQTEEGIVIFEGSPHKAKVLYGNLLWTGALALSKFFATAAAAPRVQGRACLELGAGTGVVGLTLGRLGAAPVVITDNEPELVTLMAKNIEANELGDRVHTALLDWADQTTFMQELPEIVVAADVLYEGDGSVFCDALSQHLQRGAGEAYVANHHNPKKCQATLGFVRKALSMGLRLERLEDSDGFALGSLQGTAPFVGEFQPLDGSADAICDRVRDARFHQPELSPMEHIQIFRILNLNKSNL